MAEEKALGAASHPSKSRRGRFSGFLARCTVAYLESCQEELCRLIFLLSPHSHRLLVFYMLAVSECRS